MDNRLQVPYIQSEGMESYHVSVWVAGSKDWQPVSAIVEGKIIYDSFEILSFQQAYQRMLELNRLYPKYGYTVHLAIL